jgi:FkbM family methyltransferase
MTDLARSLYRRVIPLRLRLWLHSIGGCWSESASVSQLAAGGPPRLWLALVRLLMCVKHEPPWSALPRLAIPVWIAAAGRIYVSDWSELVVAAEVFGRAGDYDLPELPSDPRTIVDLGANIGLSARFFSVRYPGAQIVALEPDPQSFVIARRNLRGLGHVSLRHLAVAPAEGTLQLHRVSGESWRTSSIRTSSILRDQTRSESFTAPAVTLDSLIEELGRVDILKIDIEGGEYEVLASARLNERVGSIVGELHPVEGWSSARFYSLLPAFELLRDDVRDGKGTFLIRQGGQR